MGSLVLTGDTSGSVTVAVPTVAGTNTLTLPAATGTVLTTVSLGTTGTSMVLIGSATASSSASIDFTNINNTAYNAYRIYVTNVIPATNNVNLLLRASVSGTFATSLYTWQNFRWTTAASGIAGQGGGAGTGIALNAAGSDNMANTIGGSWVIDIFNTVNTGYKVVNYQGYYNGSTSLGITGNGWLNGSQQLDGFRFLMDTGNIASGTFFLYGIKNA